MYATYLGGHGIDISTMFQKRNNHIQMSLFLHSGMQSGDTRMVGVTRVRMSGKIPAICAFILVVFDVACRLSASTSRALDYRSAVG